MIDQTKALYVQIANGTATLWRAERTTNEADWKLVNAMAKYRASAKLLSFTRQLASKAHCIHVVVDLTQRTPRSLSYRTGR